MGAGLVLLGAAAVTALWAAGGCGLLRIVVTALHDY